MSNEEAQANEPASAPPGPGYTKHENVVLEKFEALVYRRQVNAAAIQLMDILGKLRAGADFVKYRNDDPEVMCVLYTRLGAAIATLMTDPEFQLSSEGFTRIAVNHATLQAIFDVSAFNTADFVIPALVDNPLETDPAKLRFGDSRNMAKFFLLRALDSRVEMNFDELFSKAAKTALPVFMGMLTHAAVLTPSAYKAREQLLGMGKYFEDLPVPDMMLQAMSDVFMYTSYGVRRDKHQLKKHLSKMFRRALKDRGVVLPTAKELKDRRTTRRAKPVLLIPLEHFGSFHAMYRVYAPSVIQLRQRFYLVACIREADLDSKSRELFDEVLPIPPGQVALKDLVHSINKIAPDVVWYPSIGMATWWTVLSSVRLAPLQCMSYGHPATAMSNAIDYGLVEEDSVTSLDLFNERLVYMPSRTLQYANRLDQTPVTRETLNIMADARIKRVEESGVVRVAITSTVMKLNVPFLETLKRIRGAVLDAPLSDDIIVKDVEYHFFPNMLGVWHWQAVKILKEWLPNCVVYSRTDYPPYIARLAQCDLHFSPFPFGGTNSNIDSMTVGLPILTLIGPEIFEVYDSVMVKRLHPQLGDLVCDTVEEYEQKGARLITDSVYRAHYSTVVRTADVRGEFHGERTGETKNAFAGAVWYLYENHERIQETTDPVHYTQMGDSNAV